MKRGGSLKLPLQNPASANESISSYAFNVYVDRVIAEIL